MSLKASDSKPSDAQKHVQEIELTNDIVDQPAIRVDETETTLAASQEHTLS